MRHNGKRLPHTFDVGVSGIAVIIALHLSVAPGRAAQVTANTVSRVPHYLNHWLRSSRLLLNTFQIVSLVEYLPSKWPVMLKGTVFVTVIVVLGWKSCGLRPRNRRLKALVQTHDSSIDYLNHTGEVRL